MLSFGPPFGGSWWAATPAQHPAWCTPLCMMWSWKRSILQSGTTRLRIWKKNYYFSTFFCICQLSYTTKRGESKSFTRPIARSPVMLSFGPPIGGSWWAATPAQHPAWCTPLFMLWPWKRSILQNTTTRLQICKKFAIIALYFVFVNYPTTKRGESKSFTRPIARSQVMLLCGPSIGGSWWAAAPAQHLAWCTPLCMLWPWKRSILQSATTRLRIWKKFAIVALYFVFVNYPTTKRGESKSSTRPIARSPVMLSFGPPVGRSWWAVAPSEHLAWCTPLCMLWPWKGAYYKVLQLGCESGKFLLL
jgi:hypothetical protein